jgi:hypothetical protein
MQKMCSCNPAGFNVSGGYPALFQSLQTVFSKCHKIGPGGITFHFAALALAILDSFGHHYHFLKPLHTALGKLFSLSPD